MSSPAVQEILDRIRQLPERDRVELAGELLAQLPPHGIARSESLASARGLGKEVWNGIDAQEYVDRERDAWDG